ncbi:hypothetical protein Btru_005882 [Bulinus truncatus]|nr:hypothetical protein Btru_005882 [Bulinus truncatus]
MLPQVSLLLEDDQVAADLRVLLKVSGKPVAKKPVVTTPGPLTENTSDVRIEDGRLWYDKKWFQRNTMVQIDSKEGGPRIYGTITNIGNQEIWIKRSGDNSKLPNPILLTLTHWLRCTTNMGLTRSLNFTIVLIYMFLSPLIGTNVDKKAVMRGRVVSCTG